MRQNEIKLRRCKKDCHSDCVLINNLKMGEYIMLSRKGITALKISEMFNISHSNLRHALNKHGIIKIIRRKYDYDLIVKDYENGLSVNQIEENYKTPQSTIYRIFKKSKIKMRLSISNTKGPIHPCWKGKSYEDHYGYEIFNGERVHRTKMENVIGRRLFHWEGVHHINENRLDNSIENLIILPSRISLSDFILS